MRALMLLPLGAAIALAGCGQQGSDEIVMPEPGEYKQTAEILDISMPGLPPELATMMKSQLSASMVSTDCLTEEESKDALKKLTKGPDEDDQCDYSKYDVTPGKLDAAMACKSPSGGEGNFTLVGTFDKAGMDMTIEGDQSEPGMPGGGKMHIKMRMKSERVGECKAEPSASPSPNASAA